MEQDPGEFLEYVIGNFPVVRKHLPMIPEVFQLRSYRNYATTPYQYWTCSARSNHVLSSVRA